METPFRPLISAKGVPFSRNSPIVARRTDVTPPPKFDESLAAISPRKGSPSGSADFPRSWDGHVASAYFAGYPFLVRNGGVWLPIFAQFHERRQRTRPPPVNRRILSRDYAPKRGLHRNRPISRDLFIRGETPDPIGESFPNPNRG